MKIYPLYYSGKKQPYAKGAVEKGFVFLSGSDGRDPQTGRVVEGMKKQTEHAWGNIKSRLEEMGASLEHIVKIVFYTTSMDDWWKYSFPETERFFRENCPDLHENPRPSTLIQVAGLAEKSMLIEIDVTATLG